MSRMHKWLAASLCAATLMAQVPAVQATETTETTVQFTDVSDSAWYASAVYDCYEYGLLKGIAPGRFDPQGYVTVIQAITVAARIHSQFHDGPTSFPSENGLWYQGYLDYCLEQGIIKEGEFRYYSLPAKRAEVAGMLGRAMPDSMLESINQIDSLPDVNALTQYSEEIFKLYNSGILSGSDQYGTFTPHGVITRAELAKLLVGCVDPSQRTTLTLEEPPAIENLVMGGGYSQPPLQGKFIFQDPITELYGFRDINGKVTTPATYASLWNYNQNGWAFGTTPDGMRHKIDSSGQVVETYPYEWDFYTPLGYSQDNYGYASATMKGVMGYALLKDDKVVPGYELEQNIGLEIYPLNDSYYYNGEETFISLHSTKYSRVMDMEGKVILDLPAGYYFEYNGKMIVAYNGQKVYGYTVDGAYLYSTTGETVRNNRFNFNMPEVPSDFMAVMVGDQYRIIGMNGLVSQQTFVEVTWPERRGDWVAGVDSQGVWHVFVNDGRSMVLKPKGKVPEFVTIEPTYDRSENDERFLIAQAGDYSYVYDTRTGTDYLCEAPGEASTVGDKYVIYPNVNSPLDELGNHRYSVLKNLYTGEIITDREEDWFSFQTDQGIMLFDPYWEKYFGPYQYCDGGVFSTDGVKFGYIVFGRTITDEIYATAEEANKACLDYSNNRLDAYYDPGEYQILNRTRGYDDYIYYYDSNGERHTIWQGDIDGVEYAGDGMFVLELLDNARFIHFYPKLPD